MAFLNGEICIEKVKTATTGRLCSFARAQSSSDNQKQFRLNCNHLKYWTPSSPLSSLCCHRQIKYDDTMSTLQWWFQHIMVIIIVAIEEWQQWEGLPHYTGIVDLSNVFRVSVSATEFATMIYSALNALKCAPMYCNVEYWQVWFIPPWIPESPQASVSHSGILYTFTLSIYISL